MAGDESQPKASFKRFIARFKESPALQATVERIDSGLQAKAGVMTTSV